MRVFQLNFETKQYIFWNVTRYSKMTFIVFMNFSWVIYFLFSINCVVLVVQNIGENLFALFMAINND